MNNTGCWANPELPEYDPAALDPLLGYTTPPSKRSKPREIPNYALDRKYCIALMPEQCDGLTRNAAKEGDSNLQSFLLNFEDTLTPDEVDDGPGVQIEIDAVNPNDLRAMFAASIAKYWDDDAYQAVLDGEQVDRDELGSIIYGVKRRRAGAQVDIEATAAEVLADVSSYADNDAEAISEVCRTTAGLDKTDMVMLIHEFRTQWCSGGRPGVP